MRVRACARASACVCVCVRVGVCVRARTSVCVRACMRACMRLLACARVEPVEDVGRLRSVLHTHSARPFNASSSISPSVASSSTSPSCGVILHQSSSISPPLYPLHLSRTSSEACQQVAATRLAWLSLHSCQARRQPCPCHGAFDTAAPASQACPRPWVRSHDTKRGGGDGQTAR